jgi:hypothetical protein
MASPISAMFMQEVSGGFDEGPAIGVAAVLFASVQAERVVVGGLTIKVARVKITEMGR